jgi:hypothetical protein
MRVIVALVALLATTGLSLLRVHPPASSPGIDESYVERILNHVAAEPHPADSEANAVVGDFLAGELARLGYDVDRQDGVFGHWRDPSIRIPVRNVIARLAGTGGTGEAVLLCAHFDSRDRFDGTPADSHGAGDNGAGVAAVLEAARQFSESPPKRDVVILLPDGEEAGLRGAMLWAILTRPDFMNVIAAFNFEGRGLSGPALLFQQGPSSGGLVRTYARVAPHPVTSSLSDAIYGLMPNRTDFDMLTYVPGDFPPSIEQGLPTDLHVDLPGLNFAFIGGYHGYHTGQDRIENVSRRTLFHQAAQAVAVTRAAAEGEGSAPASADVYFDVLAATVVIYARPVAWIVLLPALGLAGLGVLTTTRRRHERSWKHVLVGLAAIVVAVCVVGQGLGMLLPHPEVGRFFGIVWIGLAGMALVAAFAAARLGAEQTLAAVLVPIAAAAVGLTILLPGASYLPAALLLVGGVVLLTSRTKLWPLAVVAAVLATLLTVPAAWLAGQALTLRLGGVASFLLLLVVLPWVPLLTMQGIAPTKQSSPG